MYIAAVKPRRLVLAVAAFTLSLHGTDEKSVTVKAISVEKGAVMVSADLQGKPTELTCEIRFSSCSQPQPGDYTMRSAKADEGIYEDCTNVVLLKSSGAAKEKVGVYCWASNEDDCYIVRCSKAQVETLPAVVPDTTLQGFTGYPPSVYMHSFLACVSDGPCTQTDKFHLDQVPAGCCVLVVTNGDGQGTDEVRKYEVFLNGERVVPADHSRSAQATVKLRPENTLKIFLSGAPHSKVFVLLTYDPRQSK